MRLHRFYIEEPIEHGKPVVVKNETQLNQWKNVFRYSAGDTVTIFDGSGGEGSASFTYLGDDEARLKISEWQEPDRTPAREVYLYMALTKKDTFEWIVEKATELGVTRIIPILAERSEKKNLNFERLKKIVVEASEQSGRVTLPRLYEVHELSKVLNDVEGNFGIAWDPRGEVFSRERDVAPGSTRGNMPLSTFIGPEGGWTPSELELFQEKKMEVRSCGTTILRAETAAVAFLGLLILPQ